MFEALIGGCGGNCGGCCVGLIVIPLLCCALVAGVAIYVYSNSPEPPLSDNFTPKNSEAQAFQAEIDRATAQAAGGWFWLQFRERDMASWMALEGEEFAQEQGHEFPFENAQVSLDNGEITFYGELSRYGLNLPLEAVVEPQINDAGEMEFQITSVDVGGVSLPDVVLRNIRQQFDDVLVQPFDDLPGTPIFYEQTLSIQDGVFTVQGQVN
jgi:hypothetical protein